MADIFLSYAKEDQPIVADIVRVMTAQGWNVFWDREIPIGRSWDEVLDEELPLAKVVTPLWSPRSVKSKWVKTEADFGLEGKKLLPAMIEFTAVPIAFRLVQYADLTTWNRDSPNHVEIVRLLNSIKKRIGDTAGHVTSTESYEDRPPLRESGESPRKVFLAYARSDRGVAEQLVTALREHFAVWWDPEIPIGATFEGTITQSLNSAQTVLVIWSERGAQSAWVRAEAQWALSHGNLVNAVIQNAPLPSGFGSMPTIDLTNWSGSTSDPIFKVLLNTISGTTGDKDTLPAFEGTQHDALRRRWAVGMILTATLLLGCVLGLLISRIFR